MENQEEEKQEETTNSNNENESKTQSNDNESKGPGSFVKWAIIILVISIIIIFGALMWSDNSGEGTNESVLATVGETQITMEDIQPELEQLKAQYISQGIDITEEQGLEDMMIQQVLQNHIDKVILLKYADEKDLEVADSLIDDEYQKILTQYGGQEALDTAMAQSQVTKDDLMEDIRNSLTFQLIAEQEGSLDITEEEIQNYYDQLKEQLGDELPPLTEVQDQVRQEITNEKLGTILESILNEVRENYEVEILLETGSTTPVNQTAPAPQGGTTDPQGEEMTQEEIMEMINEQETQE